MATRRRELDTTRRAERECDLMSLDPKGLEGQQLSFDVGMSSEM